MHTLRDNWQLIRGNLKSTASCKRTQFLEHTVLRLVQQNPQKCDPSLTLYSLQNLVLPGSPKPSLHSVYLYPSGAGGGGVRRLGKTSKMLGRGELARVAGGGGGLRGGGGEGSRSEWQSQKCTSISCTKSLTFHQACHLLSAVLIYTAEQTGMSLQKFHLKIQLFSFV